MEKEFCINMNNLNFVVFTVLNFTDDGIVNNPPKPPFINVNNVIYYAYIKYNKEKLRAHLKALFIETSKFEFYNTNLMQ